VGGTISNSQTRKPADKASPITTEYFYATVELYR
jgi:hypothetical protein